MTIRQCHFFYYYHSDDGDGDSENYGCDDYNNHYDCDCGDHNDHYYCDHGYIDDVASGVVGVGVDVDETDVFCC